MKTRFNITIEQHLLEEVKAFAVKQQTSVSGLIEAYFKKMIHPVRGNKTILDMVEQLNPDPVVVADSYDKTLFYKQQNAKYGF